MRIVGLEQSEGVHTIDMWFSRRRGRWVVERLDAEGRQLDQAFCGTDEEDAAACLEEWLRAHGETHLVGREVRALIAEVEKDTAPERDAA